MEQFADRLVAAVRRCATPVTVGLDPRLEHLPTVVSDVLKNQDVEEAAAACAAFAKGVVDVIAALVPAVKPNVAFFEQFGVAGMQALAAVVQHARRMNLLVIADAKRGDIGPTAAAYARAFLGAESQSGWGADALTVNPLLGDESLEPFVDVARARQAGLFVLVKTSNPGSGQFQDLVADGRPLYRHVAAAVEARARASQGTNGYGDVGAVVGATYPDQLVELRSAMPHSWFLVPGYGSQGASAEDLSGAFDEQGLGALVNNSRGIIFAHARPPYDERFGAKRWQEAVEAATRDMIEALRQKRLPESCERCASSSHRTSRLGRWRFGGVQVVRPAVQHGRPGIGPSQEQRRNNDHVQCRGGRQTAEHYDGQRGLNLIARASTT